jgi:RNA polymerase sigma-70 factor, ECF subfamily
VRPQPAADPDLPEPVADPGESDPEHEAVLADTIGLALLVVLDALSPAERVAFVLHDVFRYPFAEVAEIVGRTPAACRQLASSARRRLDASPAPETPSAQRADIVRSFRQAWAAKDINALIGLLDPAATASGDGGGLATASPRPVDGGEPIARYFVALAMNAPDNLTILERTVNGQPGLVAQQDGVTVGVLAFDIAGDRIKRIWAVLNPEKLRPWTAG